MTRSALLPNNFTIAMVTTVAVASLLPCRNGAAFAFNIITNIAIAALFFLHGAKLSREAVVSGATHWRLHLLVLLSTFAAFPLLALLLKPAIVPFVGENLYIGILFLCILPSTVQSSIAFVSIARGNVSAAVSSASASSLIGIFITPVLAGMLVIHQKGEAATSWQSIGDILLQLLVPFVVGQLSRKWVSGWLNRNQGMLKFVDQGSILLVVYTAFSEAVNEGLWQTIPLHALLGVVLTSGILLAIALLSTQLIARRLGFNKEDEITIMFCGSKKSLASGIPMAKVLFPVNVIGSIVLPLMIFHQIQLMVCAMLAQKYAKRPSPAP